MVGVLVDMNQMKTMELLEVCVNHWFPSDVHSLFPERLKLACKCFIELFHVSLSPAATYMAHASHPLIPTLLSSQKSPDLKIGCAQLRDCSLETGALIRTMSVNVLMIMHDLKRSYP